MTIYTVYYTPSIKKAADFAIGGLWVNLDVLEEFIRLSS